MCVLSGAWWKMLTLMSLLTLFIKYKAADLTGPLNLTPPSLSQSCVSVSRSLFLILSLDMEKLIAEQQRHEGFQWSPLASDELKCNILQTRQSLYCDDNCPVCLFIGF